MVTFTNPELEIIKISNEKYIANPVDDVSYVVTSCNDYWLALSFYRKPDGDIFRSLIGVYRNFNVAMNIISGNWANAQPLYNQVMNQRIIDSL